MANIINAIKIIAQGINQMYKTKKLHSISNKDTDPQVRKY